MEGLFFILVGAALFTQSWQLLGLYSEGRTMGVFVGGLGLLMLGTFMLGSAVEPMLLTSTGKTAGGVVKEVGAADVNASVAVLTSLVVVWAVYAVGVGAQGLWDLEERSIGFYSAFLAVVSLAGFAYFAGELESRYGEDVMLATSGATIVLSVLAGMMFFYLAFGFNVLRLVSGWFLLIGGSIVGAVGLAIVSGAVKVPA
jgi:hypothetical protein